MEEIKSDLIDLPKLKKYLNISQGKVYSLIKRSDIPYYKLNGRYYFKTSEIDNFMMSKKIQ